MNTKAYICTKLEILGEGLNGMANMVKNLQFGQANLKKKLAL